MARVYIIKTKKEGVSTDSFKKLGLVFLMALFLLAVTVGCGKGKTETQGDTINIGVNYELTGEVATYANSSKNGLMLAFEEINAKGGVLGGKKINPIVLDNANKREEAMAVATRLADQYKVVAFMGPATSGNTLAVIPVASEKKIPLVNSSATHPDVTVDPATKKVRPYVFRTCYIDPYQAMAAVEFAFSDLGKRKAAILYDVSSDYSKGLYQVFKGEFQKRGGTIVAEEGFTGTEPDFRPHLTKIKETGADILYLPVYYPQAGKIVAQARELSLSITMLGEMDGIPPNWWSWLEAPKT